MTSKSACARRCLIPLCGFLTAALLLSGCGKKGVARKWAPHYRNAVRAYVRGDYEGAVSLFHKALLFDRSNAEIYLDIAAIYDDLLGETAEAVSYYEKYLQMNGETDKAKWVRRWVDRARDRLSAPGEQEPPGATGSETETGNVEPVESLRERLRVAERDLAQEKENSKRLSEEVSILEARLSAAMKETKELHAQLAAGAGGEPERSGNKTQPSLARGDGTASEERASRLPVSWMLCFALGILVVALIVKQRYTAAKEKELLAGIGAAASDPTEGIRENDVLGTYFWIENDRRFGTLDFTEKDGEIRVRAVDGATHLKSQGKGKLLGNVLTAELRGASGKGVLTKFIFANKGRTVTAVWQGEEGTSLAAGAKAGSK